MLSIIQSFITLHKGAYVPYIWLGLPQQLTYIYILYLIYMPSETPLSGNNYAKLIDNITNIFITYLIKIELY